MVGTIIVPYKFYEYQLSDLGECQDIYTYSSTTSFMITKDFGATFTLRLVNLIFDTTSSLTIMASMSLDGAINTVNQAKYFSWGKAYFVGSS